MQANKKTVVEKEITHDDYKKCLFSNVELRRKMNIIRSDKHDVYTEEINKVALPANDVKRVIQDNKISTLVIYHYSLFDKQ